MKISVAVWLGILFFGLAVGFSAALLQKNRTTPPSSVEQPAEEAASRQETPLVPPPDLSPAEEPESAPVSPPSGFWLKRHGDKIAVFAADSSAPLMIYDLNPRLLPEQDQQRLEEGIFAESQEELSRMIEDYIS